MPPYYQVNAKLVFSKIYSNKNRKTKTKIRGLSMHTHQGKFVHSNKKLKFHPLYRPYERRAEKNIHKNKTAKTQRNGT